MNLKITRIAAENIREFGDVEIDLTNRNGNVNHVSLIQMPNGIGKTTTMDLIRTTLQGKELDQEDIVSFEPTEFDASEGSFELDFEFSGDIYTLRLELDYELLDFQYRTIRPQRTAGGDVPEHSLPLELENVMTESFVNLFVFDGELTEEFIETGSEEAENAIKIVNYLNRFDDQRLAIEDVVKKQLEEASTNVETEQGLRHRLTKLDKVKEKLNELKAQEEDLKDDIEDLKGRIKGKKEERQKLLENKEDALDADQKLERKVNELETDLERETGALLEDMRKPSQLSESFNEDLDTLYDNMEILKLPKATSEEFFRELAQGSECICGTKIDDQISEEIIENSDKYLSEDDIAVLNALKDHLSSCPAFKGFEDQVHELRSTRDELMEKRQEKRNLDLDDPELSDKVDELLEKRKALEQEKKQKERERRNLTTNDSTIQDNNGLDWRSNLALCRHRRNQLEEEVRKASDMVNFGKRADLLEEIFEDFTDQCLDLLKKQHIEDTNDRLEQILGLSKVQIGDIDDSIIIKDKGGASEGQSLSIAYAFLSTLFEDSALDVPFVVDNPAVSIDFDKSKEVAHIIPDLFEQLVIFIIPREREHFADELASDDIHHLTLHKTDTPGVIEKHIGEDFFFNFQSGEDPEQEEEPRRV